MSARASGSDAKDTDGSAKQRNHHDGSSGRSYTVEQKATVIRVLACSPTSFYDILGLEETKKTCSENDIKKAYRKLSLLTHPDKNGYKGADEAFKMVSKAFQILSDEDKKAKFDRYGGDPESRHNQGSSSSPFDFSRGGPASSSMFDDGAEMSPEEMFRQFFGGGFPGFAFETGPQFVFMGGPGGGIRMTQFDGQGPRRRPRNGGQEQPRPSISTFIAALLPIFLLFGLPLLSTILSSSNFSYGPNFVLEKSHPPYTKRLYTSQLNVPYWVDPSEFDDLSRRQRRDMEHRVEVQLISNLRYQCQVESAQRDELIMEAQGWFSTDQKKMDKARKMELKSCKQLGELGIS